MADTLDIQHGLLSFANPNYNLASPDVNSNTSDPTDEDEEEDALLAQDEEVGVNEEEDPYQALYEELDAVCRFSRSTGIPHSNTTPVGLDKVKTRRSYAQLDLGSMGVDVDAGGSQLLPVSPYQSLLGPDSENNIENKIGKTRKDLERNNNKKVDNESPFHQMRHKNKKVASTEGVNPPEGKGDVELALKNIKPNSFLGYYISLENAVSARNTDPGMETEDDPSSCTPLLKQNSREEELVPHIQGDLTNDLYAVPVKRRERRAPDGAPSPPSPERSSSKSIRDSADGTEDEEEELLPPGWERHQDDDGAYYWHISSGTIQREAPTSICPSQKSQSKRLSHDLDVICNFTNFTASSKSSSVSSTSSSNSTVSAPGVETRSHHHRRPREEMQMKRRSYPQGICSLTSDKQKPIRFAVRSLGWVEIAEEDLTPERSSKAVNKCIVDLSLGRNDILDAVGRWGDGKDLFMDLDDYCLRLTDPQDFTVLNTQPIHTIRVWGVGRDNGRDFAYVARDRVSRKHMCHVFRCDNPARIIANTLRDICKKIMIERSLQQNLAKQVLPGRANSARDSAQRRGPARPTDLPTEQRRMLHSSAKGTYQAGKCFPTPMEEPKKVLKAHYLGSTKVDRPTGMEILNIAIDRLSSALPKSEYKYVNVAVAPSTITVIEPGEEGKVLTECRVRFLSFLGIGRNVKTCAFIMHTAHDMYIAHVFCCEPSSGALCKTIEAACKLRYQKCLDAHRLVQERKEAEAQQNKGLTSTLRNVLGNLTTRLANKET